jgi:hypothetical protein
MVQKWLAVAVLGLALGVAAPRAADAAFIATMQQVGSNVVVSGSGSFDLAAFNSVAVTNGSSRIAPNFPLVVLGSTSISGIRAYFSSTFTGPSNFGTGGFFSADLGTGDRVGLGAFVGPVLLVDAVYVSGTALTASSTFLNTSLTGLGVTIGSYVWSWTTNGITETFTLNILDPNAPVGVPAAPALALFGVGLAGLLATRRRQPAGARAV